MRVQNSHVQETVSVVSTMRDLGVWHDPLEEQSESVSDSCLLVL